MAEIDYAKLLAELRVVLRVVREEMGRLRRVLERAEVLADSIEQYLLQAERMQALAQTAPPGAVPKPRPPQPAAWTAQLLRDAAATGGTRLALEELPSGKFAVCIDGGKEFTLPPLTGLLLSILAARTPDSPDDFVGWKSREHIVAKLKQATGKSYVDEDHEVAALVSRLKKELLTRGGVNPHLIHAHPLLGYRLALRRDGARHRV